MTENPGCELDLGWLNSVCVNAWCVFDAVRDSQLQNVLFEDKHKAAWLLRAVSVIDLTTLSGDDTCSNVTRLCQKAGSPISPDTLKALDFNCEALTTAAVCVYPARVGDAVAAISKMSLKNPLPVAAVATGFPSGQYKLSSRLLEIADCVSEGATEIDVVIDRSLVLTNKWELLYQELQQMKNACGSAKMKTILAVGELSNFRNIYKASLVAMMAGSDFIKTSTGKEAVNATLPVGLVMMRAIQDYYTRTSYKVGFKAAGGIRTSKDALRWLLLVKRELGNQWLNKNLFRIGASGLLGEIEKDLHYLAYNEQPSLQKLIMG